MKNYNPWRGLASYKDPQNSKHEYKFCGRRMETVELVKLVDNSLFVTLYGRTGVGKTSLLNAGVFPILRQRGYFPVYIRLSQESTDKSYAEAIVRKIEASGLVISNSVETSIDDSASATYLWSYFHTTRFEYEGKEVYPVVVLDQFEEIFFFHKEKADLLLQQVYALLTDNLVLPEGYSAATNYRFIASIREDNLYLLEDRIDELSLQLYKDNRYRLRPLGARAAAAAILEPGEKYIVVDAEEASRIVEKIIDISKDEDGTISSLILSLICSLMYEQAAKLNAGKPLISASLVPASRANTDRLLADFYLSNTTRVQRKLIEENLLTDDGHRVAARIDLPDREKLLSGGKRILQIVETDKGEKIEIVHDRMAEVIYMQRRKRDSNKFRNLLRAIVVLALIAAVGIAFKFSMTTTNGRVNAVATKVMPVSAERCVHINDSAIGYGNSIKLPEPVDPVRQVYIGDSVKEIRYMGDYWKEGLEVVVSPRNKHFVWDSLYTVEEGIIGYLYAKEQPSRVLYMQRVPEAHWTMRLPKGQGDFYYKVKCQTGEGLPVYGKKHIRLETFKNKNAFKGDLKLVSVELGDSIREIPSDAFDGCENLQSINLGNIEEIGYSAFRSCRGLSEVCLPKEELEVAPCVFYSCSSLRSVRLPKRITGNVGYLFAHCYNLESVVLPDEIKDSSYLDLMFAFCPNIRHVEFSQDSRFRYDRDSVLYYGSTPVLFNKCRNGDWISEDSIYHVMSGIVFKKENFSSKSVVPITIIPRFFVNNTRGYIIPDRSDTVLSLPVANYAPYRLIGEPFTIKEMHTPVAEPSGFGVEYVDNSSLDKGKITLYVPYGTRDAYMRSGDFFDYKAIKEDGLLRRLVDIVTYYNQGIVYSFKSYALLFYPLILVGLGFLFFLFYYFRMKQMTHAGVQDKRRAVRAAFVGIPVAIVGFVPVYYLVYISIANHLVLDGWDYNNVGMIIGSLAGAISAYVCSYLFVFSGKGKVWRSLRRIVKTGI